jgi:hypothetical protein
MTSDLEDRVTLLGGLPEIAQEIDEKAPMTRWPPGSNLLHALAVELFEAKRSQRKIAALPCLIDRGCCPNTLFRR